MLLAGVGVGSCSSVIPYVCDQQLATSRLPRASFAPLLALLPAIATVIGAIVLAQIPAPEDVLDVLLVVAGVAVHEPAALVDARARDKASGGLRRSGRVGARGCSR